MGECLEEFFVLGNNACNLCLLEHNLGNKDAVRIFCFSPWKVALIFPIPVQNGFLKYLYGHWASIPYRIDNKGKKEYN